MSSRHHVKEKSEYKSDLKMWTGNERPDFEGSGSQNINSPAVKVDLSAASAKAAASQASQNSGPAVIPLSPEDTLKVQLIEAMIESLTGKKVKLSLPQIIDPKTVNVTISAPPQKTDTNAPVKQGWGIEYDAHASESETETTAFTGTGTIKTGDGRDIQFSASITMSREFMSDNNISIRQGDAKKIDPLVINFSGTAASLTDKKGNFDLNADGKAENISSLQPGSGLLALDKNNDGVINDGSELFGPQTGNGFAELAKYDADGNGWIDEKDPVFSKLRVLEKDANGNDTLSSLKDKNIGAIYLGNVSSQFSMKDDKNNLMGEAVRTGVYIKEDGTAGTMQQIDFAA